MCLYYLANRSIYFTEKLSWYNLHCSVSIYILKILATPNKLNTSNSIMVYSRNYMDTNGLYWMSFARLNIVFFLIWINKRTHLVVFVMTHPTVFYLFLATYLFLEVGTLPFVRHLSLIECQSTKSSIGFLTRIKTKQRKLEQKNFDLLRSD